jgi:hypothetical protein
MTEAIRSSETSVLERVIWRHIPEDGIFDLPFVQNLWLRVKRL